MKTLHLILIRIWFDMIYNLIKPEEYRVITPYFCNKFLFIYGKKRSRKFWKKFFDSHIKHGFDPIESIEGYIILGNITFIDFKSVTFSNGMTPPVPRFEIELKGIEINEGKPEWGAEAGKKYFVLKLGTKLNE